MVTSSDKEICSWSNQTFCILCTTANRLPTNKMKWKKIHCDKNFHKKCIPPKSYHLTNGKLWCTSLWNYDIPLQRPTSVIFPLRFFTTLAVLIPTCPFYTIHTLMKNNCLISRDEDFIYDYVQFQPLMLFGRHPNLLFCSQKQGSALRG